MNHSIYRLDISVKRETVADPGEDISNACDISTFSAVRALKNRLEKG